LLTDWFTLVVQDTKLMCDYEGGIFSFIRMVCKVMMVKYLIRNILRTSQN